MVSVLTEVVRRIDENRVPGDASGDGTFGCRGHLGDDVVHDAAFGQSVADAEWSRPRYGPAGVRAHQPGAELGGDVDEARIGPTPGVVDDVGPGRARLLCDDGTPRVDADQLVRVGAAEPLDERHDAGDLLVGVD